MEDLLFISHRIPFPPDKGDKIRSWNFFRHLAERYRIHLACFIDDPNDRQYVEALRERCTESFFAELSPGLARLKSLRQLVTGEALTLGYFHSGAMERWIADLVARRRPQRAFVYSSGVAHLLMSPEFATMRRIIDFVDVDSDKWQQYASRQAWPVSAIYRREGRKLLEFERAVAAEFAASLFVSPREAALFRDLAPESADRIQHVNNGVDFDYFSPERTYDNPYAGAEPVVCFTGAMDYWPNRDAVIWFAEQVLPLLGGHGIKARFVIVGSNPAADVRQLGNLANVSVTGRVADVRPYLAHAAAVVAPLRVARGVQNKVLEAMAMARPLVATPQALEGIDAEPGLHLQLAADAAGFAAALAALLRDGGQAEIGRRARARVVQAYGWANNLTRLEAIIEGGTRSAVARPTPACAPANS